MIKKNSNPLILPIFEVLIEVIIIHDGNLILVIAIMFLKLSRTEQEGDNIEKPNNLKPIFKEIDVKIGS